jgi:hypothetical protein
MDTMKSSVKHIVTITAECGTSVVTPEVLLCKKNDQVYFQNLTSSKAIVMFTDGGLFSAPRLEIEAGDTRVVKASGVPFGCYPYTVNGAQNIGFTCTISKPRIIIYRPIT